MKASDTCRYLTREQQFCMRCRATGLGWVRVINVAELGQLQQNRRGFSAAIAAYRKRRMRATVRHYAQAHPEVTL